MFSIKKGAANLVAVVVSVVIIAGLSLSTTNYTSKEAPFVESS